MSSFNFTEEKKKTLTSIKNVINAQAAISSWMKMGQMCQSRLLDSLEILFVLFQHLSN